MCRIPGSEENLQLELQLEFYKVNLRLRYIVSMLNISFSLKGELLWKKCYPWLVLMIYFRSPSRQGNGYHRTLVWKEQANLLRDIVEDLLERLLNRIKP